MFLTIESFSGMLPPGNRGKRMAITLRDISLAAGVSVPTVSLILNGKGQHYSPVTRRRVARKAEELGYRANAFARGVRRGRFGTVALIKSRGGHSALRPTFLGGVQHALDAKELHLQVASLPDEKASDPAYVPRILRELSADGLLIFYPDYIPPPMRGLIARHAVPSVWVNAKLEADCVYPDDLAAGRRAAAHLIRLGHRRIAYVDYTYADDELPRAHYSALGRQAGCEQAVREAGLALRVIRGEHHVTARSRRAFSAAWLGAGDRPTGVVFYSGGEAVPAFIAAVELGLRVPGDLSFVSIDDDAWRSGGMTATTVLVPQGELGGAAVEMLQEKMSRPSAALPPRAVAFGFEPGETCAPPPDDRRGAAAPAQSSEQT
jgi:LacI family transcriptional regulator